MHGYPSHLQHCQSEKPAQKKHARLNLRQKKTGARKSPRVIDSRAFSTVGLTGFEPATSTPPVLRATRLRYSPLTERHVPRELPPTCCDSSRHVDRSVMDNAHEHKFTESAGSGRSKSPMDRGLRRLRQAIPRVTRLHCCRSWTSDVP